MDSFRVGETFVRPSVLADAEIIGPALRAIDKFESFAVLGAAPADAVRLSILHSAMAWTGEVDGTPYSCGGFSEYSSGVACIWQLGTDNVAKNAKDYLRVGKWLVSRHADDYAVVFNLISAANRASMRYVQALGFQLTNRTIMFGNHEFVYFERRRADVR